MVDLATIKLSNLQKYIKYKFVNIRLIRRILISHAQYICAVLTGARDAVMGFRLSIHPAGRQATGTKWRMQESRGPVACAGHAHTSIITSALINHIREGDQRRDQRSRRHAPQWAPTQRLITPAHTSLEARHAPVTGGATSRGSMSKCTASRS